MELLTDDAVDLYQKFLHRFIGMGSRPVHGCLVDADPSEHNIWCIRDVDSENPY